jgi:hypothetical protein
MHGSVLTGYILVALWTLLPATAHATCGEECDTAYSSEIDDCRSQFGDDPADADELAACIREARDDYRSCLDDCASAAISFLGRWRLAGNTTTVRVRSLCPGPAHNSGPQGFSRGRIGRSALAAAPGVSVTHAWSQESMISTCVRE